MTDNIREKVDEQIIKKFEELGKCEKNSKDYENLEEEIERLLKLTNDDDKTKSEESINARNRGFEDEKLIADEKRALAEDRRERNKMIFNCASLVVSSLVTIYAYKGTWAENQRAQDQAENFERGGDAYTSKANMWKIRLPAKKLPY